MHIERLKRLIYLYWLLIYMGILFFSWLIGFSWLCMMRLAVMLLCFLCVCRKSFLSMLMVNGWAWPHVIWYSFIYLLNHIMQCVRASYRIIFIVYLLQCIFHLILIPKVRLIFLKGHQGWPQTRKTSIYKDEDWLLQDLNAVTNWLPLKGIEKLYHFPF